MTTEINTFSAAVDLCVTRSGRADRLNDIIAFLRLTLRECQVLAYFSSDLIEDTISANADPFVWETPNTFRIMRSVRYPGLFDPRSQEIYPRFVEPGRAQLQHDYYYYMSGSSFVFAGHGATTSGAQNIDVAYQSYFTPLQYYQNINDRPARFILENNAWTYHDNYDDSDTLKAQARALVTNWMLERHYDMIIEGALAKLYKTTDDDRASSTFGLYKLLQKTLLHAESRAAIGGEI